MSEISKRHLRIYVRMSVFEADKSTYVYTKLDIRMHGQLSSSTGSKGQNNACTYVRKYLYSTFASIQNTIYTQYVCT